MDVAAQSITVLKGVGPKVAEKLRRLGLRSVQDALFHLPRRYQDRTRITPIGRLRPGMEAMVAGEVELADVQFRKRRNLLVRIADGTGHIHLRFFHFSSAQRDNFARGRRLRLFGEVRFGPAGLEIAHPEYTFLSEKEEVTAEQHLTPVYPTTEGLHQLSVRRIVQQAVEHHSDRLPEWLPESVLAELRLPSLSEAIRFVHQPPPGTEFTALESGQHPAQRRLVFEELLAHHLSLRRLREQLQSQRTTSITVGGRLVQRLFENLPFALTGAQRRVLDDIKRDLQGLHPMQRLVQGDVGSGKTVVAAAASLYVVEAGLQVAVMAPTELLADQHLQSFQRWLAPLGVKVLGLTGKLAARARQEVIEQLNAPRPIVAVGTQALFQEGVAFNALGLVVVDEQHRFGVHQRLQLREKGARDGNYPHQLIMTATPIPRTLAQSLYADLDVSVIDELPPGRKPIETVVVPDSRRDEVVARVHAAGREGRQVYWVCPLIEESELLDAQTATETAEALASALPDLSIGLVHGRMQPAAKEKVMAAFKAAKVQVLVATTVIEVGVDVPNASLMIIENAERLGLSQLHQLRGRIGRGDQASACVLLYRAPLSELARERLAVMRESSDGFYIAQRDLEMRGPGEVFGTRQTGMPEFRIAELIRDRALLPEVQRVAELLLRNYPTHIEPIARRWLASRENYAGV